MSWQFRKYENPDVWRIDRLQLVEQPSAEDLLEAKRARWRRLKARRADTVREHVRKFLGTMPQGETVESIADQTNTNCKLVRELVQELKARGVIIEAAYRSHVLIRVGEVTP